ncbi:MAG: hypothetical protein EZS28_002488 [Streblomastix strix]|uniref:Uncharacterized protein n=1 Tax=Streblomastix strix TaxID=222440 RepID=A0A5J4X5S6_9EUKA|nr:MAG: hypothetical protein EZS28_002488 [Streblomastix strix]
MEEDINVTSVRITPNECELTALVDLIITFEAKKPLVDAFLLLRFVFDFAFKKQQIELTKTAPKNFFVGTHEERFHVDKIDISAVKETTILNMGLLSASLFVGHDDDNALLDVNMCTEISKKKGSNTFIRTIVNPLE